MTGGDRWRADGGMGGEKGISGVGCVGVGLYGVSRYHFVPLGHHIFSLAIQYCDDSGLGGISKLKNRFGSNDLLNIESL